MATPAAIAAGAACFDCPPNQQAAMIYLLSLIAGVASPATIAAGATCYDCVPNKQAAIIYLLDQIVTNGTGGGGGSSGVVCQSGPPVAAPASGCGISIDTDNDALYIYRNGSWSLKV